MRSLHPIRWMVEHPRTADALLSVLLTSIAIASHVWGSSGIEHAAEPSWWRAALVALAVIPLAWRRTAPLTVFVATVIAQGFVELADAFGANWTGILVATYSVGAHATPGRTRNAVLATVGTCITVLIVAGMAWSDVDPATLPSVAVVLTAAFSLGDNMRRRRDRIEHLAERAERAEREQELLARERVNDERTRIARELHDAVAHSVSLMVIQAGAGRRLVHDRPDAAAQALAVIETTGRQAMDEMRRILGVLRLDAVPGPGSGPAAERAERLDPRVEASSSRAPQPSLSALPSLAASDPDLPVRLSMEPPDVDVPPGIELSAYRIVQEALTNVRKHAGRVDHVDVSVRVSNGEVRVLVEDDGRGAGADPALVVTGHGLTGMRERAAICGGTVTAGPRQGGGWRVQAVLPIAVGIEGS